MPVFLTFVEKKMKKFGEQNGKKCRNLASKRNRMKMQFSFKYIIKEAFMSNKTNKGKNVTWIVADNDTGEVLEMQDGVFYSNEVLAEMAKNEEKRRTYLEEHKRKQASRLANDNESFIFYLFREYKKFDDLKPQDAIRLVYLATYIDYDNNYLMIHNRKMTKQDLFVAIGISRPSFTDLFKTLIAKGYLIEDDGYKLNKKYFHKGAMSIDNPVDKRFIRVYINALRTVYESSKIADHVYLGYIFDMIPYINIQWNILCHNPLEPDRDKVIPMTFGEFCDEIGYDRSHLNRLLAVYRRIKFYWRDKEQLFAAFIYEKNKEDMRIVINPNIFYAGSNFDKVEGFGTFFNEKKKPDIKNK